MSGGKSVQRGIYVFHEANDSSDYLYYSVFDGQTWSLNSTVTNTATGWVTKTSSNVAGVSFGGSLYCFYRRHSQLHFNWFDGNDWQDSIPVDGSEMSGGPSAAVFGGLICVFYAGPGDNQLHYNVYDPSSGGWRGDTTVPMLTAGISHSPSAIIYNDQLQVFRQGGNGYGNQLWLTIMDPNEGWLGDMQVAGPALNNSPAAVVVGTRQMVFYQGSDVDQSVAYNVLAGPGMNWSDTRYIPNTLMNEQGSPAVCWFDGRLFCLRRAWGCDRSLYCVVRVGNTWLGDRLIPDVGLWDSPGIVVVD